MAEFSFPTNETPEIILLNISGNLRLAGWEQNQLHVEGETSATSVEPQGEGFVINSSSDCTVRVPRQAKVIVKNVSGDMRVKSLTGALEIGTVSGDVALRQIGAVQIARVLGDLSAKKVLGALMVHETAGDLSVRGVAGDCQIEKVSGDVYVRDVLGNARAWAAGDAVVSVNFKPAQQYKFEAHGDLLCRVPANTSAVITVDCSGDVVVDVLGAKIEGGGGHKVITLGDGSAQVELRSSEDISIVSLAGDPEAMGELGEHFGDDFGVMAEELSAQIESKIEAHMANLEKHLSGFGDVRGEKVSAKVKEAVERARQRAEASRERARTRMEEKMARANEKMARAEEKIARAEARAAERGKKGIRLGVFFDDHKFPSMPAMPKMPNMPSMPTAPRPPRPPADPVSDEERMMILKMVEEKKISIEEAEKLLAALEGKSN